MGLPTISTLGATQGSRDDAAVWQISEVADRAGEDIANVRLDAACDDRASAVVTHSTILESFACLGSSV